MIDEICPFPGFDDVKFPLILAREFYQFSIINVAKKTSIKIFNFEKAEFWGEGKLCFVG